MSAIVSSAVASNSNYLSQQQQQLATAILVNNNNTNEQIGQSNVHPLNLPVQIKTEPEFLDQLSDGFPITTPLSTPSSQKSSSSREGTNGNGSAVLGNNSQNLSTQNRHEKSLGLLTTRFVSLLQESKNGVLDLKMVKLIDLLVIFL